MKKIILLFQIQFSLGVVVFANGLKFNNTVVDFGTLEKWNNPPAHFVFTNNTRADFMFLPTFQQQDIFVVLPKGKIAAGQTDTIVVYYFTETTGAFLKTVDIFTSNHAAPFRLTVKGNILSLDAKAYLSCPGFAPKTEEREMVFLALDSSTQAASSMNEKTNEHEVMVFEEEEEEVLTEVHTAATEVLPQNLYKPNNIVFLIDVSGSMKHPEKLPLLKIAMKQLSQALRGIDYISLITYAYNPSIIVSAVQGDEKQILFPLIDSLQAQGFTNGVKGLQTAYDIARQHFIPGGNNQVIIATDGLFNAGNTSEKELLAFVQAQAKNEVILSVVGFGQDANAHKTMQRMSEKGRGGFIRIADSATAENILIDEIKRRSVK